MKLTFALLLAVCWAAANSIPLQDAEQASAESDESAMEDADYVRYPPPKYLSSQLDRVLAILEGKEKKFKKTYDRYSRDDQAFKELVNYLSGQCETIIEQAKELNVSLNFMLYLEDHGANGNKYWTKLGKLCDLFKKDGKPSTKPIPSGTPGTPGTPGTSNCPCQEMGNDMDMESDVNGVNCNKPKIQEKELYEDVWQYVDSLRKTAIDKSIDFKERSTFLFNTVHKDYATRYNGTAVVGKSGGNGHVLIRAHFDVNMTVCTRAVSEEIVYVPFAVNTTLKNETINIVLYPGTKDARTVGPPPPPVNVTSNNATENASNTTTANPLNATEPNLAQLSEQIQKGCGNGILLTKNGTCLNGTALVGVQCISNVLSSTNTTINGTECIDFIKKCDSGMRIQNGRCLTGNELIGITCTNAVIGGTLNSPDEQNLPCEYRAPDCRGGILIENGRCIGEKEIGAITCGDFLIVGGDASENGKDCKNFGNCAGKVSIQASKLCLTGTELSKATCSASTLETTQVTGDAKTKVDALLDKACVSNPARRKREAEQDDKAEHNLRCASLCSKYNNNQGGSWFNFQQPGNNNSSNSSPWRKNNGIKGFLAEIKKTVPRLRLNALHMAMVRKSNEFKDYVSHVNSEYNNLESSLLQAPAINKYNDFLKSKSVSLKDFDFLLKAYLALQV